MSKISILGAGRTGTTLAHYLAEKGMSMVQLVDNRGELAFGKALDLMEGSPLRKYAGKISGCRHFEALKGSNVIVITEEALENFNTDLEQLRNFQNLFRELAAVIKNQAPQPLVILCSDSVDLLLTWAVQHCGYDANRTLGISGNLFVARLKEKLKETLGWSMIDMTAMALGNMESNMIFPADYWRIRGIPVQQFITETQMIELSKSAIDSQLKQSQLNNGHICAFSAAMAAAEVLLTIFQDIRAVHCVSALLNGSYQIEGVCLSVPALISGNGIEKIVEIQLSESEEKRLREAALSVQTRLLGVRA